jgi:hypothetical protein
MPHAPNFASVVAYESVMYVSSTYLSENICQ